MRASPAIPAAKFQPLDSRAPQRFEMPRSSIARTPLRCAGAQRGKTFHRLDLGAELVARRRAVSSVDVTRETVIAAQRRESPAHGAARRALDRSAPSRRHVPRVASASGVPFSRRSSIASSATTTPSPIAAAPSKAPAETGVNDELVRVLLQRSGKRARRFDRADARYARAVDALARAARSASSASTALTSRIMVRR